MRRRQSAGLQTHGRDSFESKKKADVVGHPEVSVHAGQLANEPPAGPGRPSFSRPTPTNRLLRSRLQSPGRCHSHAIVRPGSGKATGISIFHPICGPNPVTASPGMMAAADSSKGLPFVRRACAIGDYDEILGKWSGPARQAHPIDIGLPKTNPGTR